MLSLGVGWALVSLLFFLFFSVPPPGQEQADWYFVGITILETGAFALSSLMCFRNWKSGQIVSGRSVWLSIGLGLMCFAMGNILFYLWGNVWGKDPAVSLGDAFYLLSYIFLAAGMLKAVLPRRLNLESRQWVIIAVIGLLGIALAYFFNYQVGGADLEETLPLPAATPEAVSPESTLAPEGDTTLDPTQSAPDIAPAAEPEEEVPSSTAPAWVVSLDAQLEPFESFVSLLYVVGDCLLLVVAATLLVAFWGGRFSQSWKLIAIAAFCLYIADMYFAYYVNQSDYQEGSLWEVFWTFSAVFFGLGAIVEHAISSRSRRTSRRRRA
ncbi:MAG: hypothetical protein F6J95_005440 [Leptolyngbya sp. SIO1E4]|nr:hypothetical protein [Leptolyngbya sp. SIO1E4]